MKTIRVKFVDFWPSFDETNNDFYNILAKQYELEICDNPDYLFYSVFGNDHLKYDCIKIFYTGECVCPDFNICDYAIGFENLQYEDRYIRVPIYLLFEYKDDYRLALEKHRIGEHEQIAKKKFCNFVYTNSSAQKSRTEFFKALGSYKTVDSGGRYLNNIGGPVKNKHEFQKSYKFSIAFENCCHRSYTTEKNCSGFCSQDDPYLLRESTHSRRI